MTQDQREPRLMRVASHSLPAAVASAVSAELRQGHPVVLQAIGAGAVNQAIKAAAIARGNVAPAGISLKVIPAFHDVEENGAERTAMRLTVAVDG